MRMTPILGLIPALLALALVGCGGGGDEAAGTGGVAGEQTVVTEDDEHADPIAEGPYRFELRSAEGSDVGGSVTIEATGENETLWTLDVQGVSDFDSEVRVQRGDCENLGNLGFALIGDGPTATTPISMIRLLEGNFAVTVHTHASEDPVACGEVPAKGEVDVDPE